MYRYCLKIPSLETENKFSSRIIIKQINAKKKNERKG
jgi:hypothetical protein